MDPKLEKIKDILIKDQSSRNSDDIKHLNTIISSIKFFDSIKSHKSVFRECCMYLTYEFTPKNSFLFKQGEHGDKFYILFKGEAGVIVSIKENDKTIEKEVLVYKDGSSFGELALTEERPRAASIFAKADCHFAVLDKFNYNRILSSLLTSQRENLIEFLKGQSYFRHLTKVSLLKLSYCFEEKLFKKGQVLFREDDPLEFIYCIKEGEVKLSRRIKIEMINTTEPVTRGTLFLKKHCWKKADIGILESGELLGINDLEKNTHSSTCTVNSTTAKILQVTLHHFNKRMDNEQTLSVINHGKACRNLLHQDSINSVTKILKERVASPYKKLLFQETLNASKEALKRFNDKDKSGKEIEKNRLVSRSYQRRRTMDESLSPTAGKYRTLESVSKKKEEFSESRRRVKTALNNYREASINEESDEQSVRVVRKKTQSVVVEKDVGMDLRDSLDSRKSIRQKTIMKAVLAKMNPFGKVKAVVPQKKAEEVINIHIKSRRSLTMKPMTPKNWSFMNITNSIRRPISIDSKTRNS